MLQRGRSLFYLIAICLTVVVLTTIRRLPPVVASHFDASGVPNGWSSRSTYVLLLLIIGVVLPLGITVLMTSLTRTGSPERLNIPARDYWARPEHAPEAVRRVRAYVWWLGCIMAGTALLLHWAVLDAHTTQPPRLETRALLVMLGGVTLALLGWAIGWYRLLGRPRSG